MPQVASASDDRVTKDDIAMPPPPVSLSQDREWCVVEVDGRWKKIRFHDYDEIYSIPGLYETIFYEVLKCSSPEVIREMLRAAIVKARVAPGDLRVLDLGAGNGVVGEELADLGVRHMVGVDIIRAAAEAARRDRREVYDDYFVVDMTDISETHQRRFDALELNCLTCVAALGFGDIPPAAFANAYNLISRDGWVAFNIKTDFLESDDSCGFAALIRRMIDANVMSIRGNKQYQHRLATDGEPLLYTAFVATKNRDVPAAWIR